MDNLFFITSKFAWQLLEPDNLFTFSLALIVLLFILKKDQLAKKSLYVFFGITLFIAIFPVGSWLIYPLEKRFPTHPVLPKNIDGIILLGGSFIPKTSFAWDKVQTNQYADRIHDFLALMQQYPNAKAVFSGGNASTNQTFQSEAYYAQQLFSDLGIKDGRILFEDKARNTYENVLNLKRLIQPIAGENWIVITTAWHLPRSVGIFCKQNWPVIPYPADYHTNPNLLFSPSLQLDAHLQQLGHAIYEWVGLSAYYVTGKTTQWFPQQCSTEQTD